ncbi:unnamed protein product, partial [Polarella glacialis]
MEDENRIADQVWQDEQFFEGEDFHAEGGEEGEEDLDIATLIAAIPHLDLLDWMAKDDFGYYERLGGIRSEAEIVPRLTIGLEATAYSSSVRKRIQEV